MITLSLKFLISKWMSFYPVTSVSVCAGSCVLSTHYCFTGELSEERGKGENRVGSNRLEIGVETNDSHCQFKWRYRAWRCDTFPRIDWTFDRSLLAPSQQFDWSADVAKQEHTFKTFKVNCQSRRAILLGVHFILCDSQHRKCKTNDKKKIWIYRFCGYCSMAVGARIAETHTHSVHLLQKVGTSSYNLFYRFLYCTSCTCLDACSHLSFKYRVFSSLLF